MLQKLLISAPDDDLTSRDLFMFVYNTCIARAFREFSVLELGQDPREMYVMKTTQWKHPPRLVLNARRPSFDLPDGGFARQGKGMEDTPGSGTSAGNMSSLRSGGGGGGRRCFISEERFKSVPI